MKFLGKSNFRKRNDFPKGKDWSVSMSMLLLKAPAEVQPKCRIAWQSWSKSLGADELRSKKVGYISYIPVFVGRWSSTARVN